MDISDLIGDPYKLVIFEGERVAEFADGIASIPWADFAGKLTTTFGESPGFLRIRGARRIVGTPKLKPGWPIPGKQFADMAGRVWSYEENDQA